MFRPVAAAVRSSGRLLAVAKRFAPSALDIPPLVLGLVCLAFLPPLVRNEVQEPLFGDQLVFQYTGWCIRKGLKLYADAGMCDGPFIHFLHAAIQAFVGMTDKAFRQADLVLQALGSSAMGVFLADARNAPGTAGARRWFSRLAWAGVSAALWLSWYLTLAWDTAAQRETFYMLFGSVGLVLLYATPLYLPQAASAATAAGAFLVTTQLFGKPTGVAYVVVGLVTVLLASESPEVRRKRLKLALYGAGAAVALFALLLAAFGSFRWYFFWCVFMPYRSNAYLLRTDWLWLFLTPNAASRTGAFVAIVAGVGAIATRLLPLRALGLAFLPAILFTGACLQARGYVYQFMPARAAEAVLFLVFLTELHRAPGLIPRLRPAATWLALSYAAIRCMDNIHASPFLWRSDGTNGAPSARVFSPTERKVGLLVKERTKPDDRVFVYHGNGHVLLLEAERLTASAFFHPLWLDPVSLLPLTVVKPDFAQMAALEDMVSKTRARACESIQANKPAAVLSDNMAMVFQICPPLKGILASQYEEMSSDGYALYFRR